MCLLINIINFFQIFLLSNILDLSIVYYPARVGNVMGNEHIYGGWSL